MSTFESIKISFKWTKEMFLKASEVTYKYEMKHSLKRYIGWFFIGLLQFGVVAALKKDAFGLLFISTILLTYWYGLRWPMRKSFIQKSFKSSALANTQFEASVDENGLHVKDSLIKWDDITRAVNLEDGFIVDYASQTLFLPASGFDSFENKNRFATVLKQNITVYLKG